MKFGELDIVCIHSIPNSDIEILELEDGSLILEYMGTDGVTNFYKII